MVLRRDAESSVRLGSGRVAFAGAAAAATAGARRSERQHEREVRQKRLVSNERGLLTALGAGGR